MATDGTSPSLDHRVTLSGLETAVLQALSEEAGRVMARREIARRVGIADRHERRCDSAIVAIRRHLGADAIVTVRSRGWMLAPAALDRAAGLLGND